MSNTNDRSPIFKFCLTKEELADLTKDVAELIKKSQPEKEPEFLNFQQAMEYLDIRKTKLHQIKKENRNLYYQEGDGYPIKFIFKELKEWRKKNNK